MPQFPKYTKVKITKNYINGGYIFKINSAIGFTPREMKKKYTQEMSSIVSSFRKYVENEIRNTADFGRNYIIDIKAPTDNVFFKRKSLFKGTYFVSTDKSLDENILDAFINTLNKKLTEMLIENNMEVIGYANAPIGEEPVMNNGLEAEWHIPSLPLFYYCEAQ